MLVTTLDQNDITWLAFAAGIAAGSGNADAHSALFGIISRIHEVPEGDWKDEVFGEAPVALVGPEAEDFEGTIDPLFMPPVAVGQAPSRPQSEFGPGPVRGKLG